MRPDKLVKILIQLVLISIINIGCSDEKVLIRIAERDIKSDLGYPGSYQRIEAFILDTMTINEFKILELRNIEYKISSELNLLVPIPPVNLYKGYSPIKAESNQPIKKVTIDPADFPNFSTDSTGYWTEKEKEKKINELKDSISAINVQILSLENSLQNEGIGNIHSITIKLKYRAKDENKIMKVFDAQIIAYPEDQSYYIGYKY